MRPDTAALLSAAVEVARGAGTGAQAVRDARLEDFLQLYRGWILRERDMSQDREAWVERHSILMHLMMSGSTLGEAITILTRFAEPVWSQTKFALHDDGDAVVLILDEPIGEGAEGLISTLWLLSATLCQFEFLVGHELHHVVGAVRSDCWIDHDIEMLLFGRSLEYGAANSAIRIAKAELECPIAVSTAQLPSFLASFMRHTVSQGRRPNIAENVSNLLWRSATRNTGLERSMSSVAGWLGLSESTLRRRLLQEGVTFSAIKSSVHDRLARMWLVETDLTIEQIAERLDYSDGFAFRRAFISCNGLSPRGYRKKLRG